MSEFRLELFNIIVKRTQSNQNLRLIFEMPEDLGTEKKLIEYRGEKVETEVIEVKNPESAGSVETFKSIFEVIDVKVRMLKNGDKLRIVLENMYDKKNELDLVKLRFQDVILKLEKIDQDMFENDLEDEED